MKTSQLNPQLLLLMQKPAITDILLDGRTCLIDQGRGLEAAGELDCDISNLQQQIVDLAFACGARLDYVKPIADFVWQGCRFHAVLPYLISERLLVSIRKHPGAAVELEHLIEVGSISDLEAGYLENRIRQGANLIISGPTSSGKTTLQGALLRKLRERVVVIEQIPELPITQPAVRLLERGKNAEGYGEVSSPELMLQALRMRPDRIWLGEARGVEFAVLLQAMNSGHSGSVATLHSRSLSQSLDRMLLLAALAGLDPALATRLIANSIDLVVQLGLPPRRGIEAVGQPALVGDRLVMERVHVS